MKYLTAIILLIATGCGNILVRKLDIINDSQNCEQKQEEEVTSEEKIDDDWNLDIVPTNDGVL
jgi:protein involved in sex pheromone biosynthesis